MEVTIGDKTQIGPGFRSAEALAVSRAAAGPGHDHIDLSASAFRAHKPPSPVENFRLSAMLLGLFGGVRLELMLAVLPPYDEAQAGLGGGAECNGRPSIGLQRPARRRLVGVARGGS